MDRPFAALAAACAITTLRRTEGELNQHARLIRASFRVLEDHPQRAYRDDLTAVLSELDFEWDRTSEGYPMLTFASLQDFSEALVAITRAVTLQEPRKASAIEAAMHADAGVMCIWWTLPVWVDDYPDAA